MLVGGGAAPEERALLEQRDAETGFGQGACGGESGEAASGDGDCGLGLSNQDELSQSPRPLAKDARRTGHPRQVRRLMKPFPRMLSFSHRLRPTFAVKTSYCFSAMLSSRRR